MELENGHTSANEDGFLAVKGEPTGAARYKIDLFSLEGVKCSSIL
jgi:hypothetical protein